MNSVDATTPGPRHNLPPRRQPPLWAAFVGVIVRSGKEEAQAVPQNFSWRVGATSRSVVRRLDQCGIEGEKVLRPADAAQGKAADGDQLRALF